MVARCSRQGFHEESSVATAQYAKHCFDGTRRLCRYTFYECKECTLREHTRKQAAAQWTAATPFIALADAGVDPMRRESMLGAGLLFPQKLIILLQNTTVDIHGCLNAPESDAGPPEPSKNKDEHQERAREDAV